MDQDDNLLLYETFDAPGLEGWTSYVGGENEKVPSWRVDAGELSQPEEDGLIRAILTGDVALGDYSIEAKIRIESPKADSRAGLVFRDDGRGFYVLRFTRSSGRAQLMYHSRSPFGWHELATVPVRTAAAANGGDGWVDVRVEARGPFLRCFIDGNPYIDLADSRSRAGRFGFYACEARARFDELRVRKLATLAMNTRTGPPWAPTVSFWFRETFTQGSGQSWTLPAGWTIESALCTRAIGAGVENIATLTGAPFSDGLMQARVRPLDGPLDAFVSEFTLLLSGQVPAAGGALAAAARPGTASADPVDAEAAEAAPKDAASADATPKDAAGSASPAGPNSRPDPSPASSSAADPAPISQARAGLVFRGRERSYYALILSRSQARLALVRRDDATGDEELLGGVEFSSPLEDRWYQLSVQCRGGDLVAVIDGIPCIAVNDSRHSSGYVGLYADGGPVVFTDLLAASGK